MVLFVACLRWSAEIAFGFIDSQKNLLRFIIIIIAFNCDVIIVIVGRAMCTYDIQSWLSLFLRHGPLDIRVMPPSLISPFRSFISLFIRFQCIGMRRSDAIR